MNPPVSGPLHLPALVAHRKAAAWRRAAAFVPGNDSVLGIPCRPMTPATFSQLFALRSRFIMGGEIGEGDVRNYLWIHSPRFEPGGERRVKAIRAAVLRPFERMLMAPWLWVLRAPDANHYCAGMAMAINDIVLLIEDAFADASVGGDGKPARATLEAQLQAAFAKTLHWAPERTSATPLKQLYQVLRAMSGDDEPDAGEAAIMAAHLRALNAQTSGVPANV